MVVVSPGAGNMSTSLMPLEQVAAKSPLTAEQRLTDYIAQVQAEGLAAGKNISNPAALGGVALKALNGYFERASSLHNKAVRKARAMSDDKTDTGKTEEASKLPPGPASNNLQLASNKGEVAPAKVEKRVAGVSDADMDRAIDALLSVMSYSVETSMITTATNNLSKSTSTLIRGQ